MTAKLCVSRKGEKATCVIPIIILKSIFPLHAMTVDNPRYDACITNVCGGRVLILEEFCSAYLTPHLENML